MFPPDQAWCRRLLTYAMALGVIGGLLGLGYLAITGAGIDLFFGVPTTELWSGERWWTPLAAVGGVTVAVLRTAWAIPDETSGAFAAIRCVVQQRMQTSAGAGEPVAVGS